jgi:hypothetical protein
MVIGARMVSWEADGSAIPTEAMVYKLLPRSIDAAVLSALAQKYELQRSDFLSPFFDSKKGYYFADPLHRERALSYQPDRAEFTLSLTNSLGYTYDFEKKQPIFGELISERAALRRSLDLLPEIGLSTNEFYVSTESGTLFYIAGGRQLGYTDKITHQQKHVRTEREITFIRQIDGYKVYGFGGGGCAQFRFIYNELSHVEWILHGREPFKRMPLISKDEILRAIQRDRCYGWTDVGPFDRLVVKKVELRYYEGNNYRRQPYFLPLFSIACELQGGDNKEAKIELFLPALK